MHWPGAYRHCAPRQAHTTCTTDGHVQLPLPGDQEMLAAAARARPQWCEVSCYFLLAGTPSSFACGRAPSLHLQFV